MPKTEVILTHNIVGLGAESDQVKVAAGYARNYLFPQRLAIPLTSANKRKIHLEHPIRTLGEHDVELRLHAEVTSTLKVQVESANPLPQPAEPERAHAGREGREGRERGPRTEKRGRRFESKAEAPEKAEKPEKPTKAEASSKPAAKEHKPAKAAKAEKSEKPAKTEKADKAK